MQRLKRHLTYANVMATIAAFGVLGGGAYAAATAAKNSVTTKSVRNGSLTGTDVKNDSLTGADINEASLSGAQGAKGDTGENGPAGADGTARAYGLINKSGTLIAAKSKNVASVSRPSVGNTCVTLGGGIDPATVEAVVTPDFSASDTDGGPPLPTDRQTFVEFRSDDTDCSATELTFFSGYTQAGGAAEGNTTANEGFFFIVP